MAHTNETVNYHLSQFVGTDIPNPLVDYNGDMSKIDTAIKNVADSAVSEGGRITALETQNGSETLTTTAQTLSGAVNELDSEVGSLDTRVTTAEGKIVTDEGTLATAVGNISTLAGKVSSLETKVGSAVLTTTASDCSGAINELDAEDGVLAGKITALETQNGSEVLVTTAQTLSGAINELASAPAGSVSADDVSFNGTTSGLSATNVQDAIDEVNAKIPQGIDADDVSYDNTQSGLTATDVQAAIDELAQGGSGDSWTKLGTLSNSVTSLNLPATFNKLHLVIKVSNDSVRGTIDILPDELGTTGVIYRTGYYADASHGGSLSVTVSSSVINGMACYANGAADSTATCDVYYA